MVEYQSRQLDLGRVYLLRFKAFSIRVNGVDSLLAGVWSGYLGEGLGPNRMITCSLQVNSLVTSIQRWLFFCTDYKKFIVPIYGIVYKIRNISNIFNVSCTFYFWTIA